MRTRSSRLLAIALVVLIAGVVFVVHTASAAPPPPKFWGFEVKNNLSTNVSNIQLKFTATVNDHQEIAGAPQMEITVANLEGGQKLELFAPEFFGIAKVHVHAELNGKPIDLEIQVPPKQVYDPQFGQPQYAGFTRMTQSGQSSEFSIEFAPNGVHGQPPQAHLEGRPCWVDWVGNSIKETATFN